ncbi:unnamed protein product [Rotaria socialis]|uniref:Reverse transcriptase domain-containing protein n=1 Tax=Rotaria socialis TaxID=392032 RepID=A0A818BUB2_9BILA|nr:unnamed protein product [Rotaria socialis]
MFTNSHLANDYMHIHFRFRDHIINSIINHFDQVIKTISTATTTTATDPNSSLSPSKSDLVQSTKKSKVMLFAKALKRMLSNIVQNEVIIKDSLAFASQFKSLGANYSSFKMVSFDVASLYTNIPLDETLKIILDHSYNDETPTPPIKREDMKKLLEFATKHSHFLFNGKVYD